MSAELRTPPGILLLMHDVPQDIDEDFNRWYPEEHFEERLSIPGIEAVQRYRACGSQPAYMVLYRSRRVEDFVSAAYRNVLEHPTPRTTRILSRFQNVVRAACRETWRSHEDALGSTMVVVQCKAIASKEDLARDYVEHRLAHALEGSGCMVSMSLCEADAELTSASNSDIVRRGKPDHYVDWVLLVDGYDPVKLALAMHREVMCCDSQRDGLLIGSLTRYELMCSLARKPADSAASETKPVAFADAN
ncbi:DUF4286 family protein [Cupriavidus metallidurans]|uniref:DUF4286 family protein n=1 Tax=Cupriavidus metallidurans TaxID=119219 RepID=UPI000AE084D7|nr:DUF4286 family protein [Cupriavidus metallidurans]